MDFNLAVEIVKTRGLQMLTASEAGIMAVAVGSKDRGPINEATDFSITAFVPKKLTVAQQRAAGVRPFNNVVRQVLGTQAPAVSTIDTNVVETGSPFQPLIGLVVPAPQRGQYGRHPSTLDTQKEFSTLRIGIGVTNPVNTYPHLLSVGTIGFYMKDDNNSFYLVSNNHVIGRSNAAQGNIEPVVQPGTLDLTATELQLMPALADLVQTLQIAETKTVVRLQWTTPGVPPANTVDAALAQLTNSGRTTAELHRLTYGGGILGVAQPYTVDATGAIQGSARVYKVGRTTGYTEGTVTDLAGSTLLSYNGSTAYFEDQIIVEATSDNVGPFSDSGDSGSGVLNDRHELVGLLFAGANNHTLVNPIEHVLRELQNASGLPGLRVVT